MASKEPCEDAISREAVVNLLVKLGFGDEENGSDAEYMSALWDVNNGIKKLSPITPSRPQGHWIPVSEKLPSDCNEDWVLAQIQEDNGYLWIPCIAEYRKGKDDWYTDVHDVGWIKNHNGVFKVVAWMPLPEPYCGAENGE